jgi:hypothetical protein
MPEINKIESIVKNTTIIVPKSGSANNKKDCKIITLIGLKTLQKLFCTSQYFRDR